MVVPQIFILFFAIVIILIHELLLFFCLVFCGFAYLKSFFFVELKLNWFNLRERKNWLALIWTKIDTIYPVVGISLATFFGALFCHQLFSLVRKASLNSFILLSKPPFPLLSARNSNKSRNKYKIECNQFFRNLNRCISMVHLLQTRKRTFHYCITVWISKLEQNFFPPLVNLPQYEFFREKNMKVSVNIGSIWIWITRNWFELLRQFGWYANSVSINQFGLKKIIMYLFRSLNLRRRKIINQRISIE